MPSMSDPVPTRAHLIYYACIVAPIVAGIFVILRAYTRFFITKKNYASDWVSYLTMVWSIAFSITLVPATKHGMGRHKWDISSEMSENMYFWIMVSSAFYVLSLACYKAVLLLLYLQLFGVNRKFRYCVYAVFFFTLGYLFCNLVIEFAGCQPVRKFYAPKTPGHCTNSVAQNIAFGAGHMLSDLAIAILPLPMIWRLRLRSTKEKWGLAAVLGSGLIAWLVAVTRYIIATVDLTSYDRTWIAGLAFFFQVLEVNTGIICGCTAALKPLFISARDTAYSWSRKYSNSGHSVFSRKRSQAGMGHTDETGRTDATDNKKGFIELRGISTGESGKTGQSGDSRRPTYWQLGGKIAHSAPGTQASHEEYEDGPYKPAHTRDMRDPGATPAGWQQYSMDRSHGSQMDVRPGAPPHLTSDELFEGTGVPKPRGDGYSNSWYVNEAV